MLILSARIFSKSFGGKNLIFETEYMKHKTIKKKKLAHAHFGRRIFSKFFGGKTKKNYNQYINVEKFRETLTCIAS